MIAPAVPPEPNDRRAPGKQESGWATTLEASGAVYRAFLVTVGWFAVAGLAFLLGLMAHSFLTGRRNPAFADLLALTWIAVVVLFWALYRIYRDFVSATFQVSDG